MKKEDFLIYFSSLSTPGLLKIIKEKEKYQPDAIKPANEILSGRSYSDDELNVLQAEIDLLVNKKIEHQEKINKKINIVNQFIDEHFGIRLLHSFIGNFYYSFFFYLSSSLIYVKGCYNKQVFQSLLCCRVFPNFIPMINLKTLCTLITIFVCSSCSDKYLAYTSRYQFKGDDKKPDYSNLNFWAAHPLKWDPSDSIPKPLRKEKRDTLVDVFFLHPTIYTGQLKDSSLNADINDAYLNARTDYSSILYQASVFNQHARIYGPRFREAHLSAYFTKDTLASINAFATAYADIKSAFDYYLKNYNNGRPIIIASHSQGTTHALHLLKDYFENKPLQKQLVAAYLVGMGIPSDFFSSLKMCEDPTQTGCICGWRTFRKGFKPDYVEAENRNSFVTNPITWKTDSEYAPREMNAGSVLFKFNKVYKKTTDAQIHENVIWVRKPKFPWSFLYAAKNYHAGDINLYYINVRRNIEQRIENHFLNNSFK